MNIEHCTNFPRFSGVCQNTRFNRSPAWAFQNFQTVVRKITSEKPLLAAVPHLPSHPCVHTNQAKTKAACPPWLTLSLKRYQYYGQSCSWSGQVAFGVCWVCSCWEVSLPTQSQWRMKENTTERIIFYTSFLCIQWMSGEGGWGLGI